MAASTGGGQRGLLGFLPACGTGLVGTREGGRDHEQRGLLPALANVQGSLVEGRLSQSSRRAVQGSKLRGEGGRNPLRAGRPHPRALDQWRPCGRLDLRGTGPAGAEVVEALVSPTLSAEAAAPDRDPPCLTTGHR